MSHPGAYRSELVKEYALKLGKTSAFLLVGGVSIILFGSLGVTRSRQMEEQAVLLGELNLASQRLAKFSMKDVTAKKDELEKRLSQAEIQRKVAQWQLFSKIVSVAASDLLLQITGECGVEITELSSTSPGLGNLEGIACPTLPVAMKVTGDLSGIISFIGRLNGDFTTWMVDSVQINIADTENASASFRLTIYNYQVSENGK